MKLFRFAVVGLCAMGAVLGVLAIIRLTGLLPPLPGLPPYPAWTSAHFVTAIVFASLLPLQLWPGLRARRPQLHRALGRVAVGVGALMATSGVAIAYLSPDRPLSERFFMTTFFLIYASLLGLGLRAALARDIPAHRAWMVRMTAVALGPISQRLIFAPLIATFGVTSIDTFWQLFISAAWLSGGINLVAAEVWLRRAGPAPRLAVA